MSKKHTLPDLPYDYSALEPVISGEIMEIHHKKHHQAYVNKLNDALSQYEEAEAKGDLSTMIKLQPAIRFNGGGHINHSLFWQMLAPQSEGGGTPPKGELAEAINKQFGSFEKFVEKFNSMSAPIQGSGWGWLGFCPESCQLMIWTCPNQDPVQATCGLVPLLGIDVWEHAYYLQYKNARPEYLKKIWEVVNWSFVSDQYKKAISACCKTK